MTKSVRSIKIARQTVSLVLALTLAAGCSSEADFETARQRLLQMAKEADAMGVAVAQGDNETAQQHAGEASRLLRSARYIYESGGAAESNDVKVLVGYADVLRHAGEHDLAAKMYKKATRYLVDDATLWLSLAKSLAQLPEKESGDLKDALEECLARSSDDNVSAEAYFELSSMYRRMGLYDLAGDYLEESLKLRPQADNVRIFLAAQRARRGEIFEAAAELDNLGAPSAESASLMGPVLGGALADFETYRHTFADTPENHLAYAKLLLRVGRTAEALPALERSLELDGSDYIPWNFLGSIARQNGDNRRALEAFERSLAIKPDQPRTQQAIDELAQATSPESDPLPSLAPPLNPQL